MVDILFTLALFCVFAAASLMVVLIGAGVYKNTVEKMDRNFESSTPLNYVTTKVRQHDAADSVYLATLHGSSALVLEDVIGADTYQTWIYAYDGTLRELFVSKDNAQDLDMGAGQPLMPVDSFGVEQLNDRLLLLQIETADGGQSRQYIATRSDKGGL